MTDEALIARIAELERKVNGINAGGQTTSPNLKLAGRIRTEGDVSVGRNVGVDQTLLVAGDTWIYGARSAAPTDLAGWMKLWGGARGLPWWEVNDLQCGAFVDAEYMPAWQGMPTGAVQSSMAGFPSMVLDPTNTDYVDFVIPARPHWAGHQYAVVIGWASDNTNTGNVRFVVESRQAALGTNINTSATYSSTAATVAATGQYILNRTNFAMGNLITNVYNMTTAIRVIRYGGDAADTHTGNVQLFGALFLVQQY